MQNPPRGLAKVLKWWLHAALLPNGEGQAEFHTLSSVMGRCRAFDWQTVSVVRRLHCIKLHCGHCLVLFTFCLPFVSIGCKPDIVTHMHVVSSQSCLPQQVPIELIFFLWQE